MSNRTANATKAVADRWLQEQELVNQGKGTRDWTRDQQQDILEKGKAYDENGRAIEGHHMKSVERYPEYQGNPDNIQFLSRTEHRAAHGGNFQIPTNGKYDYITKETIDFSGDIYEPCQVIDLSNPIIIVKKCVIDTSSAFGTQIDSPTSSGPDLPSEKAEKSNNSSAIPDTLKRITTAKTPSKPLLKDTLSKGIKAIVNEFIEFPVKHPTLTAIGKGVGLLIAGYALEKLTSSEENAGSGSSSIYSSPLHSNEDESADFSADCYAKPEADFDCEEKNEDKPKRASPIPHDCVGYTRRRNGREERVRGYRTGQKKAD